MNFGNKKRVLLGISAAHFAKPVHICIGVLDLSEYGKCKKENALENAVENPCRLRKL
jgi:hypothetical protein